MLALVCVQTNIYKVVKYDKYITLILICYVIFPQLYSCAVKAA